MPKAISNTSPLLYLYRAGALNWLPMLFEEVWAPAAVLSELSGGSAKGHDVPELRDYPWLRSVDPQHTPSEWLALDLGPGELAAMALAMENREHVLLLDDMLARRTAQAAGLTVWGTLRVILEGKHNGLIDQVEPLVARLAENGLWMSAELRQRILALADED